LGWCNCECNQPLQLQQNKIIRVCLGKKDLVGSTVHNYKELNVLPFKLIYQKFAILWVIKNINSWFNLKRVEDKRINRAYNAPVAGMVELHLSCKKIIVELHSGKKQIVVELHLGSKYVFPEKYHAFEGVKHLKNIHFLSHLQA